MRVLSMPNLPVARLGQAELPRALFTAWVPRRLLDQVLGIRALTRHCWGFPLGELARTMPTRARVEMLLAAPAALHQAVAFEISRLTVRGSALEGSAAETLRAMRRAINRAN
jgi:hypothetical protein